MGPCPLRIRKPVPPNRFIPFTLSVIGALDLEFCAKNWHVSTEDTAAASQ
jgi:hypothetical protein